MDTSGAVATGMPWHTARGLGSYGERMAVRYLTDRGLEVLDRNWRCDLGEIDIVARDGGCLVVCEVKTRRSTTFGQPIEAVDHRSWLGSDGSRPPGSPTAGRREQRSPASPASGWTSSASCDPAADRARIEHVVGAVS